MKLNYKSVIGTALLCAGFLAGCSSDNNPVASTTPEVEPSVPLAAQTAVINIADPTGTPTATVESQPADIALEAEVVEPGSGGAGTIDLVLSATNNATRPISNFKAIVDTPNSTLGTATVTGSTDTVTTSGANDGERFVYFGEALVTPPGDTREAIDEFTITLNATTEDPLVIALDLPTEDVGLITTDDYYGEEEIISIDTGVGSDRVVGQTGAYVYVDFDDSSSYAANATDGFLSADGRYAYVGHKSNPYVMVLDTYTGAVDAYELLPPPDEPYPSGQSARIGSVSAVTPSPDGEYFYAAVLDGAHPYDASGCAEDDADGVLVKNYIIKVELSSMDIAGQLDVTPIGSHHCGDSPVLKRITTSEDGTIGAAAVFNKGRVVIVDLDSMALLKSVNVNSVSGDKEEPHYAVVSPDGSKVYVAYNDDDKGGLDIIDTTDFSMDYLPLSIGDESSRTHDLRFGPDGRLYYLRDDTSNPLYIFDLSTDPVTEVAIDGSAVGSQDSDSRVGFSPYGDYYYYLADDSDLYKFDMSDDTLSADSPIDADSDGNHLLLPTLY